MSNEWVRFVKAYADANNLIYTDAMKQAGPAYRKYKAQQGDGFVDDVKDAYEYSKKVVKNIIYGVSGYNKATQDTLEKYGGKKILKFTLGRYPIASQGQLEGILKAKNIFNLDSWRKSGNDILKEVGGYDNMYHLYSLLQLEGVSTPIIFEKQTQIRIEPNTGNANKEKIAKERGGYEELDVPLNKSITLAELAEKTLKYFKKSNTDPFKYNSFDNNCQMYLDYALKAVGLSTPQARKFIMQDLTKLYEQLPWFINALSNIATEAEAVLGGKHKKRPLRQRKLGAGPPLPQIIPLTSNTTVIPTSFPQPPQINPPSTTIPGMQQRITVYLQTIQSTHPRNHAAITRLLPHLSTNPQILRNQLMSIIQSYGIP